MNSDFFIHPNDAKALKAMKAIPAFTMVSKKFSDIFAERSFKLSNLSSKLRISDRQLPEIYNLLPPICAKLEIPVPELYLENNPEINAYTAGDKTPFIVLTSGLITHCSKEVIQAVMAHECGHIVCHHVVYKTMIKFILGVGSSILNLPFVSFTLEYAMLYWDRCSEYSADRAAAYVCGGPDPVVKTMMELACGSKNLVGRINKEEFLKQAKEFKQYSDESKWNKFLMYYSLADMDHPFLADRASDIVDWCRSRDFASIDVPGAAPALSAGTTPDPDPAVGGDVGAAVDTGTEADVAAVAAAGGNPFKKAFAGAKKIAGKGVDKITGTADAVKEDTVKEEESAGADAVCPECDAKIRTTDTECPSCGAKLIHCPNCDAILTKDDSFCDKCGTKLK